MVWVSLNQWGLFFTAGRGIKVITNMMNTTSIQVSLSAIRELNVIILCLFYFIIYYIIYHDLLYFLNYSYFVFQENLFPLQHCVISRTGFNRNSQTYQQKSSCQQQQFSVWCHSQRHWKRDRFRNGTMVHLKCDWAKSKGQWASYGQISIK